MQRNWRSIRQSNVFIGLLKLAKCPFRKREISDAQLD